MGRPPKSTKQTMYELAATSLEAPPLLIPLPTDSLVDCSLSPPPRPQTSLLDETLPEAVRGRQEENLRAFRRKVEAYDSSPETGDGESAVGLLGAVGRPRQALLSLPPRRQEGAPGEGEQEAIRDDALARDPWFDHAEAALQIGIVPVSCLRL